MKKPVSQPFFTPEKRIYFEETVSDCNAYFLLKFTIFRWEMPCFYIFVLYHKKKVNTRYKHVKHYLSMYFSNTNVSYLTLLTQRLLAVKLPPPEVVVCLCRGQNGIVETMLKALDTLRLKNSVTQPAIETRRTLYVLIVIIIH